MDSSGDFHSKCTVGDGENTDNDNVDYDNIEFSPLQLDIILSEILDLLSLPDLKICRLVSRQWNLRSTEAIKRKRPVVTFNSSRRGTSTSSCTYKIKEFTSVMKSSPDIPFTACNLTNVSIKNRITQEFLQVCSQSMKVLILDVSKKFIKESEFKALLMLLAPSLEVLDIDYLPSSVTNPKNHDLIPKSLKKDSIILNLRKMSFPACNGHYSSKFWENIFQASVSLEEINTNYSEHTTPLLKALEGSGRLSQLISLRLEYIDNSHMDTLLSSNVELKLRKFKFNIINKEVPRKKVEQLLKKLSSNLSVLAMGSPSDNCKLRIKLPKMPKLRRLGMYHCDDSLITMESINLSRDTPILRSLELSSGLKNFDWQEYLSVVTNLDSTPSNTVEELAIGLLVSDPQCVHYLGKSFPNVNKLSLEFPRKDFLQAIWTTWTNLVELTLYFHVNNDDSKDRFICGIPSAWKVQVQIQINRGTMGPDWWNYVESPPVMDSICNLKSLQRLTIEQSPKSWILCDLTDFSVFFGFAKLRDLRSLRIGRSNISESSRRFLWNDLPMISHLDIRDQLGPGVFSTEEREELISYIKYYEDQEYEDDEHDEPEYRVEVEDHDDHEYEDDESNEHEYQYVQHDEQE